MQTSSFQHIYRTTYLQFV